MCWSAQNRSAPPWLLLASLLALLTGGAIFGTGAAEAGELTVVTVEPTPRTITAPVTSVITVHFDRPVDRSTVVARRSFWAFGRWSGPVDGSFVYGDGDATVTLVPDRPFSAGENVMVLLSTELAAAGDGGLLRAGGYSFQFWTRAAPVGLSFEEVQRFSTRTTPEESSRAYGGVAADMDGDGQLDLTVVNEDTADVRVFLNRADGSGTFESMLPPSSVGSVPSPSEPADFNADGAVDLALANTQGDSVSILLGDGAGGFASHQLVGVGVRPRGLAVLDVDGDGDVDIANTNHDDSSISVLLNDGQGTFGAPTFFGSGSEGEWALAAGDMDEDGRLDLVVGGRDAQTVRVYRAVGDGTFTAGVPQSSGGAVWMLVLGDVDGDGHEDVAAVNSFTNNGAILISDGLGGLGAPVTHATDPFSLASDLGDLDGDGDLDWVTASFSGDWFLFRNEGGSFVFDREIVASQAASCSLAFDADGDGDLDLALIDELADEVIVMAHPGTPGMLFADGFESGDITAWSTSGR